MREQSGPKASGSGVRPMARAPLPHPCRSHGGSSLQVTVTADSTPTERTYAIGLLRSRCPEGGIKDA